VVEKATKLYMKEGGEIGDFSDVEKARNAVVDAGEADSFLTETSNLGVKYG
jgi:hypothetical protein